jgi:hypothetical protein
MKLKHNKKRNTAFIYESLVREMTKAIVEKNLELKDNIVSIIKEHFSKNSLLSKELKLYKTLCETYSLESQTAEKLVYEIRKEHTTIDKVRLFTEQSVLIKKINSLLSNSVFSNFVPNYKSLATAYQIFNEETPIKKRVLLEQSLVEKISSKREKRQLEIKPINNLVYKSFVKKFNSEYAQKLISEQKELLSRYISSFTDNGLELKIFLNEELSRLKKNINNSLLLKEIKQDPDMVRKTKEVLEILNNFKKENINKSMIINVLKIQNLVKEINEDGN